MASLTAHIALPAEFRESRNALAGPRGPSAFIVADF